MAKNREQFIEVFKKQDGNISKACKASKISRQTFYDWMKDPEFKDQIEHVRESLIDFAESQLLRNISKGKTAEILFYLKTKGKKRGYIERSEIDTVRDRMFEVKVINETDQDK